MDRSEKPERDPSAVALDRFVEAWGSLGGLLGLTPSAARLAALLLASGEEWSLGEVARRLGISRGNASMSLRELRGAGVARRLARPGRRAERYVGEPDPWRMLLGLARRRRERELAPALEAARAALADWRAEPGSPAAERGAALDEFLRTLERLAEQLLDEPDVAMALVTLARASLSRGARSRGAAPEGLG